MVFHPYDGRNELTQIVFRSEGEVYYCLILSNSFPEINQLNIAKANSLYLDLKKDLLQYARNDLSSLGKNPNLSDGSL